MTWTSKVTSHLHRHQATSMVRLLISQFPVIIISLLGVCCRIGTKWRCLRLFGETIYPQS